MIVCIRDVIPTQEVQALQLATTSLSFVDGRSTAGWAARLVKSNEQADTADEQGRAITRQIADCILDNDLFQLAVKPKRLTKIMLSRYSAGNHYGMHIDDALMDGIRTDVSFTVFLSDPESYIGGELVIDSTAGEQSFKLPAGSMLVYPATTLHRVVPVESGMRLAAVGWARSFIRSAERREILFDLEVAKREVFDLSGKSPTFDQLAKCAANLVRMWAED